MTTQGTQDPRRHAQASGGERLHALDAVRGFALLLGVAFHAAMSFLPGLPPGVWSMIDNSPSPFLADAGFVAHCFRMSLFFFIAGFFARLMYHRLGARGFWSNRAMRILVPLVVGWVVLIPLIFAIWGMGMSKILGGAAAPPMPPMPAHWFPLAHLWFLYQLLVLYVGVIAVRALVARFDAAQKLRNAVDVVVTACIRLPIGVLLFGLPLAAALVSLPFWIYWTGIPTPDSSLIPQLPATVGFGTAFVLGWLVNRSKGALAALESRWVTHLLLAVVATAWLLHATHVSPIAQPGLDKTLFAAAFGVAVWGWTFGLTGVALRFLSNYSPVRRYIADASYWIYLAHLPVVAALAVWVGHWPLHWGF
jgi:peptidoglycan/LPS O-acetylase OafA/YrhL